MDCGVEIVGDRRDEQRTETEGQLYHCRAYSTHVILMFNFDTCTMMYFRLGKAIFAM